MRKAHTQVFCFFFPECPAATILFFSRGPATTPMATPTELTGDESGGEMGRSGDHDPIPS
jgi:hypothetical protein